MKNSADLFRTLPFCLILLAASLSPGKAATVSPLFARDYTVVPEPQRVVLGTDDIEFGSNWHLETGTGIAHDSAAVRSLLEDLKSRHQVSLKNASNTSRALLLEMTPGSVQPGPSQDADHASIAAQAYRIELAPNRIRIIANAEPGLFYGVQTFLQLVKPGNGGLLLPVGKIEDWPDLGLRQIYWDDAHHLEPLAGLEAAVKQASFFKINGFILKLEGHFQFHSAPALVEPQALSPLELQQLTDYGLRYHVQVIPYLDAPAHIAFILKHPEYSSLRAFPDSNYESCVTNPDTLKLFYGMFDDLLAANKGVNYFYLSTDEPYYVGLAGQPSCQESQRTKELGTVGKVLAEFVTKAAGHLYERGRTVVFWGEYPMKPVDIAALPSFLINGETYGKAFDTLFKAHGIRQMIYQATEGEERLFPHYFLRPANLRIHELQEGEERISGSLSKIKNEPARGYADLTGMVTAGWGDMGLHPETFWLGYATITSAGWRQPSAGSPELMSSFYPLFYGPRVINMSRVYQLMSYQAQLWSDTWESMDSTVRKPIWGSSYKVFNPRQPAHDQTIPLPPVPAGEDLAYSDAWSRANAQRLRAAAGGVSENDELVGLVNMNLPLAQSNRYGLEVFLAIARLCRQNLDLLSALQRVDEALAKAHRAALDKKAAIALQNLDGALLEIREMQASRNAVLRDATATWYESWLPRVEEANGRRFLHEVDDVKDHLPDRTVDMSYLVYRELLLPFDGWYQQVESSRNDYARKHQSPVVNIPLQWKNLE
jgi:hexosaminidase